MIASHTRRSLVALLFVLIVAATATTSIASADEMAATRFVSMSDIHFDPFYDPSLVTRLAGADVSGWAAIFASSTITAPSAYGADTNYPLLASFLADVKTRAADAHFATITGDILAHDFRQTFQRYVPDGSDADYRAFVAKTVQFVAMQMRTALPHLQIFPVLGNNDSDCGDYEVTPGGAFLTTFAKAWQPSLRAKTFVKQFATGGYYTAPAPLPKTIVIGLNSIYFAPGYDNACGDPDSDVDPGAVELRWLARQLASARARHEHVWLLFHIPPGIDIHKTVQEEASHSAPVSMWKSSYTSRFDRLMRRYASTVTVSLAGHTHTDEFRLLTSSYVHVTPAVSPLFGNNPAYETVTYSKHDARLLDYSVIELPADGATGGAWRTEYTFSSTYHQPAYTKATLDAVRAAIENDATARTHYFDYYGVSNPAVTTGIEVNGRAYWCGIGSQTPAAFSKCFTPPPTATSTP